MNKEYHKSILKTVLNEILEEEFIKNNSLMHKIRGEILELEYKGDSQVIQDLIDSLEARIDTLETDLILEKAKVIQLQSDKQNLQTNLYESNTSITTLQADLVAKELLLQDLEMRVTILEIIPDDPEPAPL